MKITLMVASLLAAPLTAAAQDGGISGSVTDDTGGVLPGVTVEASSAALAGPRLAFTDGDGIYSLAALPPGSYAVTFTLPGFERAERAVEVTAGLTATLDVDLALGGLFEEVTVAVTGTAIEAPAINMPHAVTVVSRETLEQQGATQLVDLFRNLNVSHGVVGERNSWYNSNQPSTLTENVANVNLRGLGASRTLVLINGRRHVPVPARLIGGRFVDVNTRSRPSRSGPARGHERGSLRDVRLRRGRRRRQLRHAQRLPRLRVQRRARLLRQRRRYHGRRHLGRPDRQLQRPSSPRSGSAGRSCRWRIARGRSTA